jgi:hypothetical protein
MHPIIAATNPGADFGLAGVLLFAGVPVLVACGILVSGLHPRWRNTATWLGLISRSVFGSLAFAIGVLMIGSALLLRGVLNQHGAFAEAGELLVSTGATLLVLGPVFDFARRKKNDDGPA